MHFKKPEMRSFRAQLTLTIALILFLTIMVISILANAFINKEFERYAKAQQEIAVNDIVENLSAHNNGFLEKWNVEYVHGVGMFALYNGYMIRLMDLRGNVVWDAETFDMEACNRIMMEIIVRMEEKRPGLSGSFATRDYDLLQDGRKIGSVAIRSYGPYFLSESDFHFLDSLNLVLAIIGTLSMRCSVGTGSLLAKRISRPIIKTSQIAAQISHGNYKIRFDGQSKIRELDEMVAAVNNMAISLDDQESLRRRMASDVAHELRTPLMSVASHLEAMIEGLWETTPQRLQSCYEEIGRLSGLVADLEQLSKVENENLQLTKTDVNLLELANTVVGNFEIQSMNKRLSVFVGGEQAHVSADKDRLNQVLVNLLSNAMKHTPVGGKIHVTVKDTDKSGVLIVEDNGIGIPEKDLPFIFERFYRADESRSRSTGGSGIGLTITKALVTAHGGTIIAKSSDGQGTRFTVTLPK